MTDRDDFGELFDENEIGRPVSDISEVLDHLTHLMADHGMPASVVLESLLNILKPGSTKASHDVIQPFRAAMFVQGFGGIAQHVEAVWVTAFAWGIGFHFGFESDYNIGAIGHSAKRAVIRSLCACLQAGGIDAEMTDNDRIRVTSPGGDEQDIDIDSVVKQFRNEMEEELGPDACNPRTCPQADHHDDGSHICTVHGTRTDPPTSEDSQKITDWMRRWMPE